MDRRARASHRPSQGESSQQVAERRRLLADRPILPGVRVVALGGFSAYWRGIDAGAFLYRQVNEYYPRLVREFYANYVFDPRKLKCVHVNMFGYSYDWTLEEFGEMLDIPDGDFKFFSLSKDVKKAPRRSATGNSFSASGFVSGLCKPGFYMPNSGPVIIREEDIQDQYQQMMNVIKKNVMFRDDADVELSVTEVLILMCLLEQIPINLAYVVANRMAGLAAAGGSGLPYGMLLNNFFADEDELVHPSDREVLNAQIMYAAAF
ncbi:uncharacterized protein [Rutidosis leptorrhynchoides]|uniref:uncharacterized protein n=1 Tax=Rutidosis leptorrhynchoides TaxID=125765 RepID=UPI003A9A5E18